MFPSILKFDFDLTLGSFWLFWVLMSYFVGRSNFLKTVLGSNHKAEKLLCFVLPSIITFAFYSHLGFYGFFGAQIRNFGSQGKVQKLLNFGVSFYFLAV